MRAILAIVVLLYFFGAIDGQCSLLDTKCVTTALSR